MSRFPDTLEPADTWRDKALCRTAPDRDMWFATGGSAPALAHKRQAKETCRACPVMRTCLAWSIETRQEWGVWGSVDETERRTLLRRYPNAPTASLVKEALRRPTLRDIYEQRTEQQPDGHALWLRPTTVMKVDGIDYTPKQLAFTVGRGRRPEGVVTSECGMSDCFALGHLADARMRREHRTWLDTEDAA